LIVFPSVSEFWFAVDKIIGCLSLAIKNSMEKFILIISFLPYFFYSQLTNAAEKLPRQMLHACDIACL